MGKNGIKGLRIKGLEEEHWEKMELIIDAFEIFGGVVAEWVFR